MERESTCSVEPVSSDRSIDIEHNLISFADVEQWLDDNPECFEDYFLRKGRTESVRKWLSLHHDVNEELTAAPVSNKYVQGTTLDSNTSGRPPPSKAHLRHQFARSRTRNVNFATSESGVSVEKEESRDSDRNKDKRIRFRKANSLPPNPSNILSMLLKSNVRLPRVNSKDIEDKRRLKAENEREFFLEIVKDMANDLDLTSLSYKILVNVGILLDADRCSLFLVEGPKGRRELVSKVFDVHAGTNVMPGYVGDNVVRIPWGMGIIGYVAEHGVQLNVPDAYQDSRFCDEVDKSTGYRTRSILCMPIKDSEGEVIGVAQAINKNPDGMPFDEEDVKVFATYLPFCGIGITNAKLFDISMREQERNRVLLEVARDLFEEQTCLDSIVLKIMMKALTLMKCERCSVLFLKNEGDQELSFTKSFNLTSSFSHTSSESGSAPLVSNGIMDYVASRGEAVNIPDAYQDPRFDSESDKVLGIRSKSIMCVPIWDNHHEIIAVAQLLNKLDGHPFDEADEQLFKAFAIFCGLGINNTLMYSEITKAMAKQSVALEVVSYHAVVSEEDVESLKLDALPGASPIPAVEDLDLKAFTFNDFLLNRDEMLTASISMFESMGLVSKFQIDYETLCRLMLTVRKNYRNVAYHNWRHAFNVCQVMHAMLTNGGMGEDLFSDDPGDQIRLQAGGLAEKMSSMEMLVLLVACLCHDLDHRGTNNAFQQKSQSPLAKLYGTFATMEHHHFNHAVMILNNQSHNIFSNLTNEEYSKVMKMLKHAILSTDLTLHFQIRKEFFSLASSGEFDRNDKKHREMLRGMLMTACDLAAVTKPWEIQKKVAELVTSEFFDQGDKERAELNLEPAALFDRRRKDDLPEMQLGWIDSVCYPLYEALVKVEPRLAPLRDGVSANREKWLKLNEERKSSMSIQSDEDRAMAGSTDSGGEDPSSVTAEYREEEALRRSFDSIEEGPSSPKAPPPTPREVKAVHFQEPLFERRGLTSKRHSITGRPFDRRLKVQTSISERQIIVSRKWRSYEEKGGEGAQS
ncbi:dual 3',5'-cyclic-AMP and -GMP phosphodiesterase 11A-like isoform X1 [Branchiostoma floridae x Branchiostoma belcheri]